MIKFLKKTIKNSLRLFGLEVSRISNAQKNRFAWLKTLNTNTILDIGANVGQFSLEINKFLPQATIFAFEPLKETFCKLHKNTSHLNRFVAFNIALGDFNGHSEIYKSDFSPSSSLLEMVDLLKDAFPHTTKVCKERIEIKKLDDLVKENNLNLVPEILIKLDVQGYEDKVINGGIEVFRKAKV